MNVRVALHYAVPSLRHFLRDSYLLDLESYLLGAEGFRLFPLESVQLYF